MQKITILGILYHHQKFSAIGGAERRFIETTKRLAEKGLNIEIIKPKQNLPNLNHKKTKLVELKIPQTKKHKIKTIYLDKIFWTICLTIKLSTTKQKYNLILSSNFSIPNLLPAYIISKTKKIPLCVLAHHIDTLTPNKKYTLTQAYSTYKGLGYSRMISLIKTLHFYLILILLKRVNLCITMTKTTAKILAKNGVHPKKIFVSTNGINLNKIKTITNQPKKYDYSFVGRISKEKGIYDLLEAFKKILKQKPEKTLIIIGDGPELENLKKTIKKQNLEKKVYLKGPCSDHELYKLLKSSKIFVFPSYFEGWGLAVGEALGCGLPTICYEIPVLKEVFSKCPSIFFVPVGNKEKLAETMIKIVEEKNYNQLTKKAVEYIQQFTWEKAANLDFKAITEIIKSWDQQNE